MKISKRILAIAVVLLALSGCTTGMAGPSSTPQKHAATTPARIHSVLLTDDDGWKAQGINVMFDALTGAGYDVTLVAPSTNYSGASMSNSSGTLSARQDAHDPRKWAVDGTPVDSVRLGLTGIMTTAPDVVVSGVNHGANVGYNLNYSGTVGAATAAAEHGVPAIAVSADVSADPSATDFASGATIVLDVLDRLTTSALAEMAAGVVVNVNVPHTTGTRTAPLGVELARQSPTEAANRDYDRDADGSWSMHFRETTPGSADDDSVLIATGYATLTPLQILRDGTVTPQSSVRDVLRAVSHSG